MLVIDDNMLKLAKMQETLLKVAVDNRQENLKKYRDIVIEIDKQAFSSLLDEIEQINNHNQTLEDELQFMEQIKGYYNQLFELQLGFKRVCELYGDSELALSDLSQIDSEYIDKRINTIKGYLINLKNIDSNKKRLQELNDKLIDEEKNKLLLSRRLLEFESLLRSNFENAEGRIIVDGQLQYISVVSEYKKLGYDFKLLLKDTETLENLLSSVNVEKLDIEEKLKTADICYNTNPNVNSKQILDEISREFFKVRYRLTMLKLLELLSKDYEEYDLFREKREKIIDLIKYRVICLKNLGERISIDPFARTKVEEQLSAMSSLADNSRMISKIKKEISVLSQRVDEMIHQNEDYKFLLNDTKDLIISTVSIGDIIDISGISLDISEPVKVEEKVILDNQIVSIGDIPLGFNMSIVRQKTNSVIKRVNQMVASISDVVEEKEEVITPDLVIVSQPSVIYENTDVSLEEDVNDYVPSIEEELEEATVEQIEVPSQIVSTTYDSSIFETVDPFVETQLFVDRTDEDLPVLESKVEMTEGESEINLDEISKKDETELILKYEDEESEMPDAFWVTQSEEKEEEEDNDVVLSFDEQINALLSDEENTKIKKLVA